MRRVCDRRLSRKEEQRKTKDCEVMKSMEHGYYNMDCMEGMRQFPDNYFSLAIVDPPYFLDQIKGDITDIGLVLLE